MHARHAAEVPAAVRVIVGVTSSGKGPAERLATGARHASRRDGHRLSLGIGLVDGVGHRQPYGEGAAAGVGMARHGTGRVALAISELPRVAGNTVVVDGQAAVECATRPSAGGGEV